MEVANCATSPLVYIVEVANCATSPLVYIVEVANCATSPLVYRCEGFISCVRFDDVPVFVRSLRLWNWLFASAWPGKKDQRRAARTPPGFEPETLIQLSVV